ncbi:MAG: Gfo/Idh/MocA family oxidoreductase [Lachnospiraceae bacterium]|nr:Gfo/Idh/MocA family oxidoreductase [Lachnospiraceae bacterium]
MDKIKVVIIGAGNISNTRHIPGLLLNKDKFEIVGVVSDEKKKIARTQNKYDFIKNTFLLDKNKDYMEQLKTSQWFKNADAVVIGTPPKQHYPLVKACLILDKHVLVEKPMMMNVDECDEVNKLAAEKGKVLYVMHSFQFSNGMIRLKELFEKGELGEIKSILELQLSNRKRRLPVWYNELPLGLYYDEAAHFFYGARKFGGELKVLNAHAQFNAADDATPRFLEAQLLSGNIPVQMYMNFNSPICEWGLILIGEKKIAIYDYFKDILIVLKNDGEHYAKDVLRTSFSFFFQFWIGFIKNGFGMISGKLLYGHDKCLEKYADAIRNNQKCFELSGELGREVVRAMNEVIYYAERN